MTDKEIVANAIQQYMDLQRVKKANGGHENAELDYLILGLEIKLSSMGVNVKDLTL